MDIIVNSIGLVSLIYLVVGVVVASGALWYDISKGRHWIGSIPTPFLFLVVVLLWPLVIYGLVSGQFNER